ncbi:MAG: hypothetical protein HY986_15845 [Candidatus Melainabacteria bacterium]|nr:hypothetical protein [Candidatus Melainabacteria bacterium]
MSGKNNVFTTAKSISKPEQHVGAAQSSYIAELSYQVVKGHWTGLLHDSRKEYVKRLCELHLARATRTLVQDLLRIYKTDDLLELIDLVAYQTEVKYSTLAAFILDWQMPTVATLEKIAERSKLKIALDVVPLKELPIAVEPAVHAVGTGALAKKLGEVSRFYLGHFIPRADLRKASFLTGRQLETALSGRCHKLLTVQRLLHVRRLKLRLRFVEIDGGLS